MHRYTLHLSIPQYHALTSVSSNLLNCNVPILQVESPPVNTACTHTPHADTHTQTCIHRHTYTTHNTHTYTPTPTPTPPHTCTHRCTYVPISSCTPICIALRCTYSSNVLMHTLTLPPNKDTHTCTLPRSLVNGWSDVLSMAPQLHQLQLPRTRHVRQPRLDLPKVRHLRVRTYKHADTTGEKASYNT